MRCAARRGFPWKSACISAVTARIPGTEATFTENVSSRGARVLSSRRWKINDRMIVTTLAGSFRSVARVAYCQTTPNSDYAVGLEFVEASGGWVVGDGFKG